MSQVGRKPLFLALMALLLMLSGGALYSQVSIDVVPTRVTFDSPVRQGEIVAVIATIENQGTVPIGPPDKLTVRFRYIGATISEIFYEFTKEAYGVLDPGRESIFEAELDTLTAGPGGSALPPGNYRIRVDVDPDGEIKGESSGNNTLFSPADTPLVIIPFPLQPDLLVTSIKFSPGLIIAKGTTSLLIGAEVTNSGTSDAFNIQVGFQHRLRGKPDFEPQPPDPAQDPIESLRRRRETRSAIRSEDVSTWQAGVYLIRAWVDPENLQRELEEGNNTLDKQLFIIDLPRIWWFYPSCPIPLEKPEDEKPIGAIASGVAVATVTERDQERTVVYFGSNDGHLYALNADGTERWKYLTQGAVTATPAIAKDRIYFGSDDGHLYALSSAGSLAWQYPASGAIAAVKAAPALRKDSSGAVEAIYFGSDDGNLYALNPDGSLRWKFATGAFVRTTPAIGPDGTVYFGSGDGNLYALQDQGDRALLRWTFPTGSFIKSSPVIFNETVYFGSSDGHLYALFLDGTKKWEYPLEGETKCVPPIGAVEATPLVALEDGTTVIYFGSVNGGLCKVEDRGSEGLGQWQFKEYNGIPLGPIRSSPISQDEMIYFGSDDGTLYAVRDRGSTVGDEWVFPTRGMITGSPAIEGDRLYLPSWEGHLYALDLK